MTEPAASGRKLIDADGVHDLIAGLDAAAFLTEGRKVWLIRTADNHIKSTVTRQLLALGYERHRDFETWDCIVGIDAAEGVS